jgi:REP element-mobilizing transposase RayT
MTLARAQLVDPSVTRWYHCITRCVRRAHLLGEGLVDRKQWLEDRLRELSGVFSIAVAGFSVMDNHLHVLLRLDPDVAAGWSDEEVIRRWGRLFPPRDRSRKPLPVTKDWVEQKLADARWVAQARERLASLSWFMKCLKEPLSRLANREDEARGAFFEERFKSVAILDEEALLATAAYIDLNPVAAGLAELPETSEHTSIKARVEHVQAAGQIEEVVAATGVDRPARPLASDPEAGLWLCPVEDRRARGAAREGMLEGLTLGHYLQLVDYTGRMFRAGKAIISAEVASIFERLNTSAAAWQARLKKLQGGQLFGRFFASTRETLRALAKRIGVRKLANLAGCPTG